MMRLCIKEMWSVLGWQKHLFWIGYFKRQITSNLTLNYAYKNQLMRGSEISHSISFRMQGELTE